MQAANFARGRFDDDIAERDLAVATHGDMVASPYRENSGAVELLGFGTQRIKPLSCASGLRAWSCRTPQAMLPSAH